MRWPVGAVRQQIPNRNGQIMIRVHQTRRRRDDAVTVAVRIVRERDLVSILQRNEARHRIWTGAVHANLAIVIHCHERERGIDDGIDDFDV